MSDTDLRRDRGTRRSIAGVARHGRLARSSVWRTVLGLVGGAMAVVLAAGVSVAGVAFWQLESNIAANAVTLEIDSEAPPVNIAEYEGGFNILVVGSDTREGQGGIGGSESSTLNDVTMLLHVAQDQQSATLVSFPRDMFVPIPACSNGGPASSQKINTALYYGGLDCVVRTVEGLTGLEIQFAGLITFQGVIHMTDAVGGVDVCIAGDIDDRDTGLHLKSGTNTLQGAQALAFLRTRHGVGDGSDLSRISSQQVYLSSLVRKLKSDGTLTDLGKVYALAQAATQNITLSKNFSRLDILASIALVLKDVPTENIVMVQYPGTTAGGTGGVTILQAQANALLAAIKSDRPLQLDASSLDGYGSVADPNAPTATATPEPTAEPTDSPTATATPTPTATVEAPDPVAVTGVQGQSAADYTCSQSYQF